ncbi:cytidylyltransferase domain-containing protein [Azospirillum tabaci]|uniref:acylneuraminate cytidylyltransferase family protein n=1 Tax=Azospirillum tabaci TaxID=2752310 RepID=UPI0016615E66|nr:acylneuraminate cytidylyltransferase family protein [Azospirillum tabaci]
MTEPIPPAHPSCLAVIPARGGSKGIPNKNIVPLCGLPLIVHAIRAALGARAVSRLVVSTDSDAIAAIAAEAGAEVVRRPADISGDTASSESAVLHVLDVLRDEKGYDPDLVALVQCTSPLMLPEDIDGTIAALLNAAADCAFSAVPFHHFLWRHLPDGQLRGINHTSSVRARRQDREPEYLENGAVYVMRKDGFRRGGHRFFGRIALHVADAARSLEIDEPDDLILAEALLSRRGVRAS